MGKHWKIGNNQSPWQSLPWRFVGIFRWREPASMGERGTDPLQTTLPITIWEARKSSNHSGILALQAAFPPMPWLRSNGKAMRARREFGCNLTLGVTTGGTHKPLGMEHFLWQILTNPWMPLVIFGGWIISWNARARPFLVKRPRLHQWIHWRYFCGTWSLGFFILHSSKNRKGKKLEDHWLAHLNSRTPELPMRRTGMFRFGWCCSVNYWNERPHLELKRS